MPTFAVYNNNDSGSDSLRSAIVNAESTFNDTTIDLSSIQGEIKLNSPLPTFDKGHNISFTSPSGSLTINGQNLYPIFRVNGDNISFSNLTLANGFAQGGDGYSGGGGGLGAGGALLITRGSVQADTVTFINDRAQGGSSLGTAGKGGDGTGNPFGENGDNGGNGGPGGGFNDGPSRSAGGVGGNGHHGPGDSGTDSGTAVELGTGGGSGGGGAGGGNSNGHYYSGGNGGNGAAGGFGAGGGGGGGGGGAGASQKTTASGGTGGASGQFAGASQSGTAGQDGDLFCVDNCHGRDGGAGGGGAGLGGAVFVYSGARLTLKNDSFKGNAVIGGTGFNNGQAKGRNIFAADGSTVEGVSLTFNGQKFDNYNLFQDSNDVYGTIAAVNLQSMPSETTSVPEPTLVPGLALFTLLFCAWKWYYRAHKVSSLSHQKVIFQSGR